MAPQGTLAPSTPNWQDNLKHVTFINSDNKRVRLSNLEKTFSIKSFSKEGLEIKFNKNKDLNFDDYILEIKNELKEIKNFEIPKKLGNEKLKSNMIDIDNLKNYVPLRKLEYDFFNKNKVEQFKKLESLKDEIENIKINFSKISSYHNPYFNNYESMKNNIMENFNIYHKLEKDIKENENFILNHKGLSKIIKKDEVRKAKENLDFYKKEFKKVDEYLKQYKIFKGNGTKVKEIINELKKEYEINTKQLNTCRLYKDHLTKLENALESKFREEQVKAYNNLPNL